MALILNSISTSYFLVLAVILYVLCDMIPFVQFKNVKNTHGGVLLLVNLQAKSLYLYQK